MSFIKDMGFSKKV